MRASFVFPFDPHAKGRPRWVSNGATGHMITPPDTRRWERALAAAAVQALPEATFTGPVRVDVLAVWPRPKRLRRRVDPFGLLYRPARPDADNVRKWVLDSLKRHWSDDAQVVAGETIKVYSRKSEQRGRVVISISDELEDPEVLAERLGLVESWRPESSPSCGEGGPDGGANQDD